jgi:GH35 family endo-1,4-beta-xylanase
MVQTCASLDPKPKLFINDYQILSGGGGNTAHRDHYDNFIKMLTDRAPRWMASACRATSATRSPAPEDMLAILDRYAKHNKTIWITEFDVVQEDEEMAGSFTRDFYTTLSAIRQSGYRYVGFWTRTTGSRTPPCIERTGL